MELGEEGDRFEYISLGGCRIAPPCEARASNRLLAARIQDTRIRGLVGISSHSPILPSPLLASPPLRVVVVVVVAVVVLFPTVSFPEPGHRAKGGGGSKVNPRKRWA